MLIPPVKIIQKNKALPIKHIHTNKFIVHKPSTPDIYHLPSKMLFILISFLLMTISLVTQVWNVGQLWLFSKCVRIGRHSKFYFSQCWYLFPSSQSPCYRPTNSFFFQSCLRFYCSLLFCFLPVVSVGSNIDYSL